MTRHALNLSVTELSNDYLYMLSRLYSFLKLLYKPSSFSFEKETRIILDKNKISNNIVEEFDSDKYYYVHGLLKKEYEERIIFDNNKFILKLDSFNNINLKMNIWLYNIESTC